MAHQALYRVYRSRTFSEVVGQEVIKQTLTNAVKNDRISHAYIFNGPRGTGKTSVAKIFAKAINCLNPVNGDCCNECSNCKGVNNNTLTDIMEIDAASNTGVDQIRYIIENTNFLPSITKYKVYIIDEVHSLSSNAFNALLKTLEEPPLNVVFILATTEGHKLMPTILSRCQKFDFKSISEPDIITQVKKICTQEGIIIEENAVKVIAKNAVGGLRDALSLLDQAASFNTNNEIITEDMIHLVSGSVNDDILFTIIKNIADANSKECIDALTTLLNNGKNLSQIINDLLNFLKDYLLFLSNKKQENQYFSQLNQDITEDDVHFYIKVILDLQNDIRFTILKQTLLQIAILKMCSYKLGSYKSSNTTIGNTIDNTQIDHLNLRINILEDELSKMKSTVANINNDEINAFTGSGAPQEQLIDLKDIIVTIKENNPEKVQLFLKGWPRLEDYKDLALKATAAFIYQCNLKAVTNNGVFLLTYNNKFKIETNINDNYEKVLKIFNKKNQVMKQFFIILEKDYAKIIDSLEKNEVIETYDFGIYKRTDIKILDEISKNALRLFGNDKLKID